MDRKHPMYSVRDNKFVRVVVAKTAARLLGIDEHTLGDYRRKGFKRGEWFKKGRDFWYVLDDVREIAKKQNEKRKKRKITK